MTYMESFEDKKDEYYKLFIGFLDSLIRLYRTSSYDYIVLTTRRCFCLFYALEKDLAFKAHYQSWFSTNKDLLEQLKKKIISSQCMDIIGSRFYNTKVLLVDDIMIHGKTVYKFYKKAKIEYNAKTVDTLVLIRNIENPDYYYFKTENNYYTVLELENIDWKEISNIIVSYLHDVGQLYISYIYGYKVSKSDLEKNLTNNDLVLCKHRFDQYISHKTYKEDCQPIYYLYKGFSKYTAVRNSYLRVYGDVNTATAYVIPYVDIKTIDNNLVDEIWNNIWKKETVPSEFSCFQKSTDKYKSIIAIISYVMLKKIFGHVSFSITQEIDRSYVTGFIDIASLNIKSDMLDIVESIYKKQCEHFEDYPGSIMMEEKSKLKDRFDLYSIEEYFYSVGTMEDKEYINKIKDGIVDGYLKIDKADANRISPISADEFYSCIPDDWKEIAIPMTIYLLDNGISSHIVESKNGFVGTFIKSGEQSYHLFSDLTGVAFKAIYVLLDFINKFVEKKHESEFKNSFIEQLEEKMDAKLFSRIRSLKLVINNPPIDYRADYFAILKRRNYCLSENDMVKEKSILSLFVEIIKSIRNSENCK